MADRYIRVGRQTISDKELREFLMKGSPLPRKTAVERAEVLAGIMDKIVHQNNMTRCSLAKMRRILRSIWSRHLEWAESMIEERIKFASQFVPYNADEEDPSPNELRICLPEMITAKFYWRDGVQNV